AINSTCNESVIVVILLSSMILIFLCNWRMTLIASMSIPLAILCAVIGLAATGNTINVMTLGGLALAIGPLVDDAIVVLENTHRHHALGKSPLKAAYDGAGEVTLPVLVATLTTIIVLCPIALWPRVGREFFPQVDAGQIIIYVRAPSGVNIDECERRVIQVEQAIHQTIPAKERRKIVCELGVVPNWSSAYTANSGTQDAVVKI